MKHRPLKQFGQNFLTNPFISHKIVSSLNILNTDTVLEIGPGHGVLTELIIEKEPSQFIAVEIDRNLAQNLQTKYNNALQIIEKDFLDYDLSHLKQENHLKIIGNIPYNITSPILFKLLEFHSQIECSVLMIQKEVAKRITAKSGNKDYGILAIMMQVFSHVEYLFDVQKTNFDPIPKVDSAVIKISYFKKVEGIENLALFRKLVRGVFNNRRKMLRNTLTRIFDQTIVSSLGNFNLTRRPEELSVEEFKQLANKVNQLLGPSA